MINYVYDSVPQFYFFLCLFFFTIDSSKGVIFFASNCDAVDVAILSVLDMEQSIIFTMKNNENAKPDSRLQSKVLWSVNF